MCLRTYRLRAGLTQKDVAFLLSLKSASIISRIEKCYRAPSLLMLLGYCIIFETQPGDLVPRLLHDIEKAVIARARVLGKELEKQRTTKPVVQRVKFLKRMSSTEDDEH